MCDRERTSVSAGECPNGQFRKAGLVRHCVGAKRRIPRPLWSAHPLVLTLVVRRDFSCEPFQLGLCLHLVAEIGH